MGQLTYRPSGLLEMRLKRHKETTDAPFQKTIDRAVEAFLNEWEAANKMPPIEPPRPKKKPPKKA